MMNKKVTRRLFYVIYAICGVCSITACSESKNEIEPNGAKINAGNLVFNLVEVPFNADKETATRATKPFKPDTIDLGNGVEAEITIERDTVESQPETRAIKSGYHYTIIAFKTDKKKE